MMVVDGSGDTSVVLVQEIGAPPEVVFDFFVDPVKMIRWMGSEAELDPQVGGKFWVNMNGTDRASGSYVEVDRPRRVVFTWGWEASAEVPPGSSTVTVTLEGDADSTVVELRHDGLPSTETGSHEEGWRYFLPFLVDAAGGTD